MCSSGPRLETRNISVTFLSLRVRPALRESIYFKLYTYIGKIKEDKINLM